MPTTRFLGGALLCGCLLACSSDEPVEPEEQQQSEREEDAVVRGDASSAGKSDAAAKRDASATDDDEDGDDDADGENEPDAPTSMGKRDAGGRADDAGMTQSDGGGSPTSGLAKFSFFVTSLDALRELSGSQNGFGGDLRFGETGAGAGLRGADKICTTIAEESMPGSGAKGWRAFLSTVEGPVHAIDRIGDGPWYDRTGRLVSQTKADLMQVRPASADNAIKNDLPNENGIPNHNPDGTGEVDNHHVLTGSSTTGQLYQNNKRATCDDWTKSAADTADQPRVGLMWPRGGGRGGGGAGSAAHWISAMDESGCAPGVSLIEMGGPIASNPTVGSGGGYGAIYCFALMP